MSPEMRRILKDIQTGRFTSEWMREFRAGLPRFKATRRLNDEHPIEESLRRNLAAETGPGTYSVVLFHDLHRLLDHARLGGLARQLSLFAGR